ncbi:hypothetical protein GCM10011575_08030 [Microlunatus endophyticus]|uniref:Uncharacterized protein n=1 Tax=Microlunatus endophyticus TaxID=1716077 RepID=A0A917S446_9ACTN|nr:hypothetical protein [Microlunatus endophyticus]GGL52189.1 hypothetical protein GCM10011575_08030 [Microlunatus endophyticus]
MSEDGVVDSEEYRLELGKRADDLGRVLSQVGRAYELRAAGTPPNAVPELVAADLNEVDQFLSQLEAGGDTKG